MKRHFEKQPQPYYQIRFFFLSLDVLLSYYLYLKYFIPLSLMMVSVFYDVIFFYFIFLYIIIIYNSVCYSTNEMEKHA